MKENDVLEALLTRIGEAAGTELSPNVRERRGEGTVYKWFPLAGDGRRAVYRLELRFFSHDWGDCRDRSDSVKAAILTVGDREVSVKVARSGGGAGYLANAGLFYARCAYEVSF